MNERQTDIDRQIDRDRDRGRKRKTEKARERERETFISIPLRAYYLEQYDNFKMAPNVSSI